MTPLERAVIEAARAWRSAREESWMLRATELLDALEALDTAPATEQEIPWSQLAEGDELKSLKNGKFYRVLSTIKMADGYHIKLDGIARELIRQGGPGDTKCIVRRGPTGTAIDAWVDVLSSGGK